MPALFGNCIPENCVQAKFTQKAQSPSPMDLRAPRHRTGAMRNFVELCKAEVDEDNKVDVFSDVALLPQDFEIVDAVSQWHPEAQGRA